MTKPIAETSTDFSGASPDAAASHVVVAIRAGEWKRLSALLSANPKAVGKLEPWMRKEGPPRIVDSPVVQQIPELMSLYPGKYLVRFEIPDEPRVYKLEVVAEPFSGEYRVIDFWGLGW